MKNVRIVLVGCLLFAGGVFAQDGVGKQKGKEKRKEIIEQLNLSDDQQAEMKIVMDENRQKVKELKADSTLSEDERKMAFKELQEERKTKVNEILTEEQIEKLKEIKKQHRAENAKSPEERAQMMTDKMVAKLELETDQTEKVSALNLKTAKEISELKQNEDLTPESRKESVKAARENHKTEMKTILTDAQFATYEQHLEERKKQKEAHRSPSE